MTAAVAVLETAVATHLVGPALLLLELPRAATTKTGCVDTDSTVVAGGIGRAVRTGPTGRAGVPSTTGVAEGEALIGAVRADALTVLWVQTGTDDVEIAGGGVVDAGRFCRCSGIRSAARSAVVATEGQPVLAVLVAISAHLADGHESREVLRLPHATVAEERGRGQDLVEGRTLGNQVAGRLDLLLVERRKLDGQGDRSRKTHAGGDGGLEGETWVSGSGRGRGRHLYRRRRDVRRGVGFQL